MAVLRVAVEAPAVDDPRWLSVLQDVVADPARAELVAQVRAAMTPAAS